MLLQHILTKDIFLRVFAEDQFHKENDIAQRLDALEGKFFTGDVRREAIDRLRSYYSVIGRAADEIADYAEKQGFLKAVYEDFYKAYNPAAADRLGVVYTPNEVRRLHHSGDGLPLGEAFRAQPGRRERADTRPCNRHRHIHHKPNRLSPPTTGLSTSI